MGQTAWTRVIFCIALLPAVASPAMAGEQRWTHFGVRPLAMGNAYVAVADDYNALFYNPAGLARLKTWSGELINPKVAISTNTIAAIQGVQKLLAGSTGDTDKMLDFLQSNTGKNNYFDIGLTPHLVFPGFGLGLGVDVGADLTIHREISVDVDLGPRAILPIAYARNFFDQRLSIGAGVKAVAEGGVNHQFSINDINALSKSQTDTTGATAGPKLDDYVEGGYGVGADVGVLFTPVRRMQPTLGLSVTDLGGTPFTKTDVSGQALAAPRTRLPSVNVGFSFRPWEAHGMYLLTAVDAHSINQPIHYSNKFNVGAEWGYGSIIKFDTGLHQGQITGGFQFDVFLLTVRFATYTEQLGTIAGQDTNLGDRRYALQVKLLI